MQHSPPSCLKTQRPGASGAAYALFRLRRTKDTKKPAQGRFFFCFKAGIYSATGS